MIAKFHRVLALTWQRSEDVWAPLVILSAIENGPRQIESEKLRQRKSEKISYNKMV